MFAVSWKLSIHFSIVCKRSSIFVKGIIVTSYQFHFNSFQVLLRAAGPEEMKWPQKGLYTYNVREGDSFILDEKAPLPKLKTNAKANSAYSTSPKVYGNSPIFPTAYLNQHARNSVTFAAISPKQMMGKAPTAAPRTTASKASRNLFGDQQGPPEANNNDVKEKNSNQQQQ